FFLSGSAEFGGWVEDERARLTRELEGVIEALADRAAGRGNQREAIQWWRRLAATDPLRSRYAMGLITALASAGDCAGALQHARVHEALVRDQLDAEPEPAVRELVTRLRQGDWPTPPIVTPHAPSPEPNDAAAAAPMSATIVPPSASAQAVATGASDAMRTDVGRGRRWPGIASIAALAASVALTTYLTHRMLAGPATAAGGNPRVVDRPEAGAASAERSIAVLPFVNMSADRGNDYFSDGMTEELISALTKVRGLRVAARTSAFAFKGRNVDAREIAHRLDVGSVLEGSVRKSGDRLRISAELIDATDGKNLWSETYDRSAGDVFAVQDDISRAIVGALRTRLTPNAEQSLVDRPTKDVAAYDFYLQGRYASNQRTEKSLERSARLFEQAIVRDSTFAPAYAALAQAYVLLGNHGYVAERVVYPKASAASLDALRLDSTLAEAHLSLAMVRSDYEWNVPA